MFNFDDAERRIAHSIETAKAMRDGFQERADAWVEAERRAAYIKGVIYGVQHGYAGLLSALRDDAGQPPNRLEMDQEKGTPVAVPHSHLPPPPPPPPPPAAEAGASESEQAGGAGDDKKPRRSPGHNDFLVMRALRAHSESGMTQNDVRKYVSEQYGEHLADSSARVTLKRLEAAEKALQIDTKWFPAESASTNVGPNEKEAGGRDPSASLFEGSNSLPNT